MSLAAPFTCLGHDRGLYYYLSHSGRQVLELSASAHTKLGLLQLAPLQYWEATYAQKHGANWDAAANALIQTQHQAGIYDPARVRGRGAWWDDGRTVLHLGDRLLVNGAETPLLALASPYIYEAGPRIQFGGRAPLCVDEAKKLLELCKALNWAAPLSAHLLAGWCVVAPICGALAWRPHVLITGPASAGKTWVHEHILRRSMGDIAFVPMGATTEPGIRQGLGHDARPVLFDEAERQTRKGAERMEAVVALMRQASSETEGSIYKGSTSGHVVAYRPRACFGLGSIGVPADQYADQTRITILTLAIHTSSEKRRSHFEQLQASQVATLTQSFVSSLHARTAAMIPTIRDNAETFARAGTSVLGSRRLGDQIGTLIAGAYALVDDGRVTVRKAAQWLSKQDWSDERAIQDDLDELACLRHLMQQSVLLDTTRVTRSVGQLIARMMAADTTPDTKVTTTDAEQALKMVGIRVTPLALQVHIANTHVGVARLLAGTTWQQDWSRILRRIPGAVAAGHKMRFTGAPERYVSVPVFAAIGED